MKKNCLVITIMCLLVFTAISQPNEKEDFAKKYNLTEEQFKEIEDTKIEMHKKIEEAKIELRLLKAILEKELFADKVNMQKVEKLLRESLEWQMQIELSEITIRIKMKKVMGSEKWEQFIYSRRDRRKDHGQNKKRNKELHW